METFLFYFILFVLYSICGWFIEEIVCSIKAKKFVNRGFLIGPYCPIYGCGALLMIWLLGRYSNDAFVLFVLSAVLCTVLEYLTSLIMEKLFHARWWDYSDRKFNVNGRVCLVNSIFFGLFGCLLLYYVNPFITSILNSWSTNSIYITGFSFLAITLVDVAISLGIMIKFKFTTDNLYRDHTEEIAEQITKRVRELLSKDSFLHRRLFSAFPDVRAVLKEKKVELEKFIDEKKSEIDEIQEQIKQKASQTQEELQKAFKETIKKLPKNK